MSCEELDFLVDLLKEDKAVLGSRMMGGGFGGCTINLVRTENLEKIKSYTYSRYLNKFKTEAQFYEVNISSAARLLV